MLQTSLREGRGEVWRCAHFPQISPDAVSVEGRGRGGCFLVFSTNSIPANPDMPQRKASETDGGDICPVNALLLEANSSVRSPQRLPHHLYLIRLALLALANVMVRSTRLGMHPTEPLPSAANHDSFCHLP